MENKGRVERRTFQERPQIFWAGKDVAPYLYGDSLQIFHPQRKVPWSEDLEEIQGQVVKSRGKRMFGVELRVIEDVSKLEAGQLLPSLTCAAQALSKNIFRITKIEDGVVYTRIEWPPSGQGWEGAFRLKSYHPLENGVSSPTLDLIFQGRLPESLRKPSFLEKVREYASDMSVLIECWAIVKNPDFLKKDYFSFDPFERFWRAEFERMHHDEFKHKDVWEQLQFVQQTGSLKGINRILDDRRNLDLINPLLEQMQYEILTELRQKPELVEVIFSKEASSYWQKWMRVIFERYYGPKGMVFVGEAPVEEPREMKIRSLDEKTQRRLEVIGKIIKGTKFDGVREAAKAAWERLTGRPFQEV